jgi:hypothetical protein
MFMDPIRLEDRFRSHVNKIDSFWFTYFAITNPQDYEGFKSTYFNSPKVIDEEVKKYCDMWDKAKWN